MRLQIQLIEDRTKARDWHGVMDAAADIREMESEIETWEQVLEETDV